MCEKACIVARKVLSVAGKGTRTSGSPGLRSCPESEAYRKRSSDRRIGQRHRREMVIAREVCHALCLSVGAGLRDGRASRASPEDVRTGRRGVLRW